MGGFEDEVLLWMKSADQVRGQRVRGLGVSVYDAIHSIPIHVHKHKPWPECEIPSFAQIHPCAGCGVVGGEWHASAHERARVDASHPRY